jgi:hypothetical protein
MIKAKVGDSVRQSVYKNCGVPDVVVISSVKDSGVYFTDKDGKLSPLAESSYEVVESCDRTVPDTDFEVTKGNPDNFKPPVEQPTIRQFGTGANRDTDVGKLDFEAFDHPLLVESYARYLNKHRKLPDGTFRDGDNWQKMFGDDHFAVCMKSAHRHFFDVWKQHRGIKSSESLEDSINATIFNLKAYLFKILKEKQ